MSLVGLKLLFADIHRHGLVALGARQCQPHGLVKELESLDFVNGFLRTVRILKDDKSLTLGLEVLLGNNIDNIAKLGKDGSQSLGNRLDLDAFFKVLDVDTIGMSANNLHAACRVCNDTHVEMGGAEAILMKVFCVQQTVTSVGWCLGGGGRGGRASHGKHFAALASRPTPAFALTGLMDTSCV